MDDKQKAKPNEPTDVKARNLNYNKGGMEVPRVMQE